MSRVPQALDTRGFILAVDDNANDLALVERTLTKNGYNVRTVGSCEEALRLLQVTIPKILIFDVDMPGMTGYELSLTLKKNNRLKEVPVVFLSGDESRSNFKAWREAGGVFYVPKSSDLKNLLSVVRVLSAPRVGTPSHEKDAAGSATSVDAGSRFADRRGAMRYDFAAPAEVFEPISGARLAGRTSDISNSGCYLEVADTLPPKSAVQLRIASQGTTFESWASVVHAEPGRGMGLIFLTIPAKHHDVLSEWIRKLSLPTTDQHKSSSHNHPPNA